MTQLRTILRILWNSESPMTVRQITEVTGFSSLQIHWAMTRLRATGLVKRISIDNADHRRATYQVTTFEGKRRVIQRLISEMEEQQDAKINEA